MFVRNVAEDTIVTDNATVSDSQFPNATPATSGLAPPISMIEPSPKLGHPEMRYQLRDGDHGEADLAEGGVGGHDAPNWSRTKSSMILFGATILYAVIAGLSPLGCVK